LGDAILSPRLKSAIRNSAFLFLGCVVFHVAGTWNLPLIDRDEPRFAEASREMMERGDYVIPYFNNQFRFDKPPLTYWAQVASYRIVGESDFAARFPSAIAAALTALSIFAWGLRIGGKRVAWWAAIVFTLSLQTLVHAKAAVADMWLVLFVTLAHWSGYELLFGDPQEKRLTLNPPSPGTGSALASAQRPTSNIQSSWWWTFYFALAFAFLAKGPIGWTPLLTVVSTMFFTANQQAAQRFKFLRGLVLTFVVVALWGIPALVQTHGEFFRIGIGRHVIGRSFGAMEGHGANSLGVYLLLLPFYFVTVFASFFPWSLKLPWLARRLWKERDKIDNYLLAGTVIIFVIFTFVKTKLPHYTLPAFPLLALLLSRHLAAAQFSTRTFRNFAAATVVLFFGIALVVPSFVARFFPAADLFKQSCSDLVSGMEFGAIDFTEPSLVWYFRSRVKGFMTPLRRDSVGQFMEKGGPRFVIVPTDLAPNSPSDWKRFSSQGVNVAKGKRVDLTLMLKPE
jgi:4-amino-4-deoxy-L-arabinose transferase-like glycosyltransferase